MKMGKNGYSLVKVEALLRLIAFSALALATILAAIDNQTILFLGVITKKADFRCAKIFVFFVYLHAVCAGYSLAQFVRCLSLIRASPKVHKLTWSSHFLKWVCYLVDQMVVYLIFAINCAAMQFALFAIEGEEEFEWLKLCNKYKRFCFQIGGSLLCGFFSFIILALISGVSTFSLFRWYSPNFLCLKPKRICVVANGNS